jgi:acid phosphatase type 7
MTAQSVTERKQNVDPLGESGDGLDAGLASADEVFVASGDIASRSSSNDKKTALLLDGIAGTAFTLVDNAYPKGTSDQFANCYGLVRLSQDRTPGNRQP